MRQCLKVDIDYINKFSDSELALLEGKTLLITGATGLIGYNLVSALASSKYNINIIALVRNLDKAEYMFKDITGGNIKYIVGDVTKTLDIEDTVDYIIHAASQTSSKAFVDEPVETILTAFNGTINMLELAKKKKVDGFVYLSTMEVYGAPETDEKIREDCGTNLNTMAVRSSYPESKRMCETLCKAYQSEYKIPVKIIRLTQTIGPGVRYNDGRVFAEFARCAIEKRDIVLHTKGETKRNYLYTADAITAILTVLLKGNSGEAYNVANEETYCSIYEMAEIVVRNCGYNEIKLQIDNQERNDLGYAPILKMNLDTRKIRKLGWNPSIGIVQMYENLIASMMEERKCE